MQSIVVAVRSKGQGIVVNFVDTTMQRAALLCLTVRIDWRKWERNRVEYIFSYLMPLILRNVFTSFIFSKLEIRDSQNLAKLGLGGKPYLLVL